MTAAAAWAEALSAWAIPEEILSSAPESPWGFPASVFTEVARHALEDPHTPTHQQVIEALPPGGSLIDVGCGSGAASLPAAPPAGRIIAVDEHRPMLEAFADLAAGKVAFDLVEGRWPDVAAQTGRADVTVCANVAYNVAELAPFLQALTASAQRRVVLELSAGHPQSPLSPLWRQFWALSRPTRPTADDAVAVVEEVLGIEPSINRWRRDRPFMGEQGPETAAWVRRRLCLTADRDAEVAAAIEKLGHPSPAAMVTLSWPGSG